MLIVLRLEDKTELVGFHLIAFVMLMVKQFVELRFQSA
jgi:hypothetical protein